MRKDGSSAPPPAPPQKEGGAAGRSVGSPAVRRPFLAAPWIRAYDSETMSKKTVPEKVKDLESEIKRKHPRLEVVVEHLDY